MYKENHISEIFAGQNEGFAAVTLLRKIAGYLDISASVRANIFFDSGEAKGFPGRVYFMDKGSSPFATHFLLVYDHT